MRQRQNTYVPFNFDSFVQIYIFKLFKYLVNFEAFLSIKYKSRRKEIERGKKELEKKFDDKRKLYI